MTGRLLITLFSAIAWRALAGAVPADPTITAPAVLPRQANAAFIGYISYNGTWYSQTCQPGLTWYQSGNYAQCCPDTVASCVAPTACVAGSQIYPFGTTTITTACKENYNNNAYSVCNTVFIFESFGDSNPKTDIVCGDSSVNWSYYRSIPATATETSSELPSSLTPVASASTGKPSPTSSSSSSGSKAWIAGAVVGPVVGIALIAGIAFFLIRRNKNKNNLPQTGGATMGGPPPGVAGPFTDTKPQMSPDPAYPQPGPGFNPNDPYNPQRFSQQPSPAPQYSQPGVASPPVQQHDYYPQEQKDGYFPQQGQPPIAELGGAGRPGVDQSHIAEMPGEPGRK